METNIKHNSENELWLNNRFIWDDRVPSGPSAPSSGPPAAETGPQAPAEGAQETADNEAARRRMEEAERRRREAVRAGDEAAQIDSEEAARVLADLIGVGGEEVSTEAIDRFAEIGKKYLDEFEKIVEADKPKELIEAINDFLNKFNGEEKKELERLFKMDISAIDVQKFLSDFCPNGNFVLAGGLIKRGQQKLSFSEYLAIGLLLDAAMVDAMPIKNPQIKQKLRTGVESLDRVQFQAIRTAPPVEVVLQGCPLSVTAVFATVFSGSESKAAYIQYLKDGKADDFKRKVTQDPAQLQNALDAQPTPVDIEQTRKQLEQQNKLPKDDAEIIARAQNENLNIYQVKILRTILHQRQELIEQNRAAMSRAAEGESVRTAIERILDKLGKLFDKIGEKIENMFGSTDVFTKSPIGATEKFSMVRSGRGVDIKADKAGAEVTAVCSGKVFAVEGGRVTIERPNGDHVTYSGLKEIRVAQGDNITSGTALGTLQSDTLRFEIKDKDGTAKDPTKLFKKEFIATEQAPAQPAEQLPSLAVRNSPLEGNGRNLRVTRKHSAGTPGIEITTAAANKPVRMVADGKITRTTAGLEIEYAEGKKLIFKGLDAKDIPQTQLVKAGEEIGKVGASKKFEIQLVVNGTQTDPESLFKDYVTT